jgi:hypothetical protein
MTSTLSITSVPGSTCGWLLWSVRRLLFPEKARRRRAALKMRFLHFIGGWHFGGMETAYLSLMKG